MCALCNRNIKKNRQLLWKPSLSWKDKLKRRKIPLHLILFFVLQHFQSSLSNQGWEEKRKDYVLIVPSVQNVSKVAATWGKQGSGPSPTCWVMNFFSEISFMCHLQDIYVIHFHIKGACKAVSGFISKVFATGKMLAFWQKGSAREVQWRTPRLEAHEMWEESVKTEMV